MTSSTQRERYIANVEKSVLDNRTSAWEDTLKMDKYLLDMYSKAGEDILAKINQLRANVELSGGQWEASEAYKFNRLNNLMGQVTNIVNSMGIKEVNFIQENLESNFVSSYLHTSYALGKGVSIGIDFQKLNPEYVKQSVNYPWSGAMFSDRIWDNKRLLVKNVREGVTQSMILGESMGKLSKRINDNIDNSAFNAIRVARTEMMRTCYVAERHSMQDSGVVQKLQYFATIPSERTCPICGALHKKVFKMGEEPQLPKHPMCRCTYLPVIDEYGIIQGDGNNTVETDGKSFEDWEKEILKKAQKHQEQTPIYEEFKNKVRDDLGGIKFPKTKIADIIKYFDGMESELKDFISKYYDVVGIKPMKNSSYHLEGDLYLEKFKDTARQTEVFYHELGHAIDYFSANDLYGDTAVYTSTINLTTALNRDAISFLKNMKDEGFKTNLYKELRVATVDPAVSDTVCSITQGEVTGYWGHSKQYYKEGVNRTTSEVFANLTSLKARGKIQEIEFLRGHFPTVIAEFEKVSTKIIKGGSK